MLAMVTALAAMLGAPTLATAAPAPASPREETDAEHDGSESLQHCQRFAPTARFKITLPEEATLDDAVKWMSSISCIRFIFDPKLRSTKVTIISPEPVTLVQAYNAFHSALQVMGLAVVPSGSYQRIVESTEVSSHPVPVVGPGARPAANDKFVTKLYRPRSGDVEGVANLMGHFVSKQGSVVWVEGMIVLTDTGANIRRILQIVAASDKPAKKKERVYLLQLQHADPDATAEMLREVFPEKK